jgi:hypothetical protein
MKPIKLDKGPHEIRLETNIKPIKLDKRKETNMIPKVNIFCKWQTESL